MRSLANSQQFAELSIRDQAVADLYESKRQAKQNML